MNVVGEPVDELGPSSSRTPTHSSPGPAFDQQSPREMFGNRRQSCLNLVHRSSRAAKSACSAAPAWADCIIQEPINKRRQTARAFSVFVGVGERTVRQRPLARNSDPGPIKPGDPSKSKASLITAR